MSDRVKGFTIVLEHDIHEDDAEEIQNALLLIRGVMLVHPSTVVPGDWFAEQRVKAAMAKKLNEVLHG